MVKAKTLFGGVDIEAEVDKIRDSIAEMARGSDKVVWTPDSHPSLIFKLAEGSQIKQIPADLLEVFQPFYEYVLPKPVEFEDIIFYRVQIQELLHPFVDEQRTYYPNNNIKIHAAHKAINRDFLWALLAAKDEEYVIDFCKWNMETGVSSSNWGFNKDNKPRIFDYGSVQNEKWREISLIQNGFYYEDSEIRTVLPE